MVNLGSASKLRSQHKKRPAASRKLDESQRHSLSVSLSDSHPKAEANIAKWKKDPAALDIIEIDSVDADKYWEIYQVKQRKLKSPGTSTKLKPKKNPEGLTIKAVPPQKPQPAGETLFRKPDFAEPYKHMWNKLTEAAVKGPNDLMLESEKQKALWVQTAGPIQDMTKELLTQMANKKTPDGIFSMPDLKEDTPQFPIEVPSDLKLSANKLKRLRQAATLGPLELMQVSHYFTGSNTNKTEVNAIKAVTDALLSKLNPKPVLKLPGKPWTSFEVPQEALYPTGDIMLSPLAVKTLLDAASESPQKLQSAVGNLEMTANKSEKFAIKALYEELLKHVDTSAGSEVGYKAKIDPKLLSIATKHSTGKLLVADDLIYSLQETAEDDPVFLTTLADHYKEDMDTVQKKIVDAIVLRLQWKNSGTDKSYLDWTDELEASKSQPVDDEGSVLPVGQIHLAKLAAKSAQWTKVGSAKGSTEGGLYQNELGEKFYIKQPKHPGIVRNELLARELYSLAGVKVLEGEEITMDGKIALASPWKEGLTGSGTNPKNLKGTLEGFAADAWLANWDSVGVGSTKYDNILNMDGEAVRVDAGGALLYTGTGGWKGVAFGEDVTELDGLRDSKVNPVAATVFGDMTFTQIKESAKPVLSIKPSEIKSAVYKHFGDDPKSESVYQKLLARQNSIREWVKKYDA